MAVTASQHPEGLGLDLKAQSVPSTDKMAMDLDVNGSQAQVETVFDSSPDFSRNRTNDDSPSASFSPALNPVEVICKVDVQAHSSNDTSALTTSQQDTSIGESQLPETNRTTTNAQDHPKSEDLANTNSELFGAADSAHNSALHDLAPASSVPPVVDAPQSDLREDSTQFTPEKPNELQGEAQSMEVDPKADEKPTEHAAVNSEDQEGSNITFETASDPVPKVTASSTSPISPNPKPTQDNSIVVPPTSITMTMARPSKVLHGREDDVDEPSAKRHKTDESAQSPVQNGDAAVSSDTPITPTDEKELVKMIKNAARTKDGKNFAVPVIKAYPTLAEAYNAKVTSPMDFETMETKLKNHEYAMIDDVKADIDLMRDNCLLFNGPDHEISKAAEAIRKSLLSKLSSYTAPKPAKKARRSTPGSDLEKPARRVSRVPPPATATPVTAPVQQSEAFALNPATQTPLIRRDSTKTDGRPKREIHPPKNKDLPYTRPEAKGKKNIAELKFCEAVLSEMKKPRYFSISDPFFEPVDTIALNLPNYHRVVKRPIAILDMSRKLTDGSYSKAKEFEQDMRLMFKNCHDFNGPTHPVCDSAREYEAVFDQEWAKKDQWIASLAPATASPADEPESEEQSEDEQAGSPPPSATVGSSAIHKRLITEQTSLIQLMRAKVPDNTMIAIQEKVVAAIQDEIAKQESATTSQQKTNKKAKAPRAPRKPALTKKAATRSTARKPKAASKTKYIGMIEKQVISEGMGNLADDQSEEVLDLIKRDRPDLAPGEDGNLEIDIEAISAPTLWKIHSLIMKYAPEVQAAISKSYEPARTPAKPATKKKNKPMSKREQEANLDSINNALEQFERVGSDSQEPTQQPVEEESSGDEDSDSEED